jgi:hypothetical protein
MSDDRSRGDRNAATFLALGALVLFVAFLIALASLVMPQILGLVAVVALFAAVVAFHYVVWGWWLGRMLKDDPKPMTEDPANDSDRRPEKPHT